MSNVEQPRAEHSDDAQIPEINPHDPATFAAAYDLNDEWRREGRAKLVRIASERPAPSWRRAISTTTTLPPPCSTTN